MERGIGSSRRTTTQTRRRYRERTPTPTPTPTPSPSPPSSPTSSPHPRGRNDISLHLPTPVMRVRYEQYFCSRPICMGKEYDMDGLNQWHDFDGVLNTTGLRALTEIPNEMCPNLVRMFYSNATTNEVTENSSVIPWIDTGRRSRTRDTLTTYMFRCVLRITPDYINGIFHQTNGGDRLPKNWDMTNAFQRIFSPDCAIICAGERQTDHLKHLRQKDLLPICRLFHHMICYNICPRANSSNISIEDVFLMNAMMDRRPLDVGYLVVQCMCRVLGRKDTHLAYGRLINYILHSWGFDLSNYSNIESRSFFTKDDIARRLGFIFYPQSNQYFRAERGVTRPRDGNGSDDQGFDLNLDDLSLPWHEEGMGEAQWHDQTQTQQQPGPGQFNMDDIRASFNQIIRTQSEHGQMLQNLTNQMNQYFQSVGFRPEQAPPPSPPPPSYQPPTDTDDQGGPSSRSHHFF